MLFVLDVVDASLQEDKGAAGQGQPPNSRESEKRSREVTEKARRAPCLVPMTDEEHSRFVFLHDVARRPDWFQLLTGRDFCFSSVAMGRCPMRRRGA
jgi:hypothetical protein